MSAFFGRGQISVFLITTVVALFVFSEATKEIRSGRIPRFANEGCDKLIPAFVDQLLQQGDAGECEEVGHYPKPGDCTVFFKCITGRGRILPFKEYCARGYTFVNDVCIPNHNSTDCPQYDCIRMSDAQDSEEHQSNLEIKKGIDDPIITNSTAHKTQMQNLNSEEVKILHENAVKVLAAPQISSEKNNACSSGPTATIMLTLIRTLAYYGK